MRHTKLFQKFSALALAAALALSLCGCTAGAVRLLGASAAEENGLWSWLLGRGVSEDNPGGGATLTDTVRNLEIEWLSGEVNLSTHAADTMEFSEEANRALDEDTVLRYTLEGDTLRIQFCKDREGDREDLNNLQKVLTVYLPQSVELDEVEIDAVAANVLTDGVHTQEMTVQTVAGGVELKNTAVREELSIGTVAGSVTAGETGARDIRVETVAGSIQLYCATVPEDLDLAAVSGSVKLTLPKDAVFRLDVSSQMGRVTSDFAAEGSHGEYRIGQARKSNGTIQSVVGSVKVRAAG